MPVLSIRLPESLKVPNIGSWTRFIQTLTDYMVVGHVRYGAPMVRKGYLDRLEKEIKAYKKTGNKVHLINAAVYCWLEGEAPQHELAHLDEYVDSVTRKRNND